MGDNFVYDALRHGVQSGNLSSRTGYAESLYRYLFRQGTQLFIQTGIAGPRGLNGISVGAQIDGGQYSVVAQS
ncbi:MAG: hypothetical protein A4E66_02110 [Syntrophus sp. PtaB.Bin001]|nr:MAG: hypothetical protein A4E66_02110 [Syntrophus sp. PtaB.Bin001]